ncbi:hypothetical protein ACFQHO_52490 [Actinomadura yumaensis]|uniref:AfsR/SARP family transcriptional regulator n=1 Tax=Actinomadura yumaensis TaxID=111807 RepID=UPI00361FD101
MRYEILGPFQVVDEDGKHTIRARKIRVLLTVLLVRADQVVPVDQLITEIWGRRRPAGPPPGCTSTSPRSASSCTGPAPRTPSSPGRPATCCGSGPTSWTCAAWSCW